MDDFWRIEELYSGPHKVALAVVAGDEIVYVLNRDEQEKAVTMCNWRNDTISRAYLTESPRQRAA